MTIRLYDKDVDMLDFSAVVKTCAQRENGYVVTLDQTAFFPEGGGQGADHGTLGGVQVLDAHDVHGEVEHLVSAPLTIGSEVRGHVDTARRLDMMQQHSGEHMFSGLVHGLFGYDNVGFHMGTDEVTIDFNGVLEWGDLMAIEEKANGMIWENLEISAVYPEKDELDAMEYRSKKELTGAVRIVSIPGGDVCACCGTHVERTGEIGLVKFLSMIHYKGGVRISLLCGKRAVEDYERKRDQVQKISVLLSARPGEISRAVEKLKDEEAKLQEKLVAAYDKLIASEVRDIKEGDGDIFILEPDFEAIQLRHLVNRLLEEKKGRTVLALGGAAEGSFLYVLGSRDGDMRRLSRELNGLLNGRGGGSAQMAQGTFFATKDQLQAILKEKGFMSPVPCN